MNHIYSPRRKPDSKPSEPALASKKALLFEKRSKNFCNLRRPFDPTRTPMSKSFLVLFLKKELLSFTLRESGSMPIGIKQA